MSADTHQWRSHDAFHRQCERCGVLKRFEDFDGNPIRADPTGPVQCFSLGRVIDGCFVNDRRTCIDLETGRAKS